MCGGLQNQDYRIQYDAIQRIFVLPKSASPHTLLVIAVQPPVSVAMWLSPKLTV